MASQPREEACAIYIAKWNSWYWVVPQGQRSIYCGPYATQALAEKFREDVDGYAVAHDWRRE